MRAPERYIVGQITMSFLTESFPTGRRDFLKGAAGLCAAAAASPALEAAKIASNWKKQIGLELYTVRRLLKPDTYDGILAKLASYGYTEVEPADPYNNMEPAAYKAMLDKHGIKMFSTHADATEGPGLEKELEGQALMGIKYTAVRAPRPAAGQAPAPRTPMTVESVKKSAARMNSMGAILKKFGMKYYIHNHAGEFEVLDDGKTTQYDILLAETDPKLVTMQLDIGWAYMAGQDVLAMFKKHPGRFELWHVKDAKYKQADPSLKPNARARASKIVTMGEGDIDYKAVFAAAKQAGLKHYVIEQDTAGEGGRDPMEDCRIACENLKKIIG